MWACRRADVDSTNEGVGKLVTLKACHDEGDHHPDKGCVTTDLTKDRIE